MINILKLTRTNQTLLYLPRTVLSPRGLNVCRNKCIVSNFGQNRTLLERVGYRVSKFRRSQPEVLSSTRFYAKSTEGSDDDHNPTPAEESFNPQLPATVAVPEVWPHVPVLAINKNIVFPRFIKLIELTNPQLIELVRRKVKLNQPYCGIFLKKKEENEAEVVSNVDDIYNVGVFAQIHEMQDLGDRLRLVVMAHRRIKIKGQILENVDEEPKGRYILLKITLTWFVVVKGDGILL